MWREVSEILHQPIVFTFLDSEPSEMGGSYLNFSLEVFHYLESNMVWASLNQTSFLIISKVTVLTKMIYFFHGEFIQGCFIELL